MWPQLGLPTPAVAAALPLVTAGPRLPSAPRTKSLSSPSSPTWSTPSPLHPPHSSSNPQTHPPPFCSLNRPSSLLPQGLCKLFPSASTPSPSPSPSPSSRPALQVPDEVALPNRRSPFPSASASPAALGLHLLTARLWVSVCWGDRVGWGSWILLSTESPVPSTAPALSQCSLNTYFIKRRKSYQLESTAPDQAACVCVCACARAQGETIQSPQESFIS